MANGKTRRYGNKGKLLTWIQLRCQKCGHFLSTGRKKYCIDCAEKVRIETKKLWKHNHYNYQERHEYHLRTGK